MSFDCAALANFIKEAERLDAKVNKATETSTYDNDQPRGYNCHCKHLSENIAQVYKDTDKAFDRINKRLDFLFVRVEDLEKRNKTSRPQALDLSDDQLRLLVRKRVETLESRPYIEPDGTRVRRITTTTATQPGVHETDAGHGDGAK